MIHKEILLTNIKGIKMKGGGAELTCLLFADVSLFLTKAFLENICNFKIFWITTVMVQVN